MCDEQLSVGFTSAGALVHELIDAWDDRRRLKLLIVDELGFVPLSKAGAELLFQDFSQRYKRESVLGTTNLHFDERTGDWAQGG